MKKLFMKTTTTLAQSINIASLSPFISPLDSIRFIRGPSKCDLQLTKELKEVVVGKMLGDLGSERPNLNSNTRLSFKHTDKQIEYIEHLYLLFKDYCKSSPITLSRYDDRPDRNKEYKAVKFNTCSLPCFN